MNRNSSTVLVIDDNRDLAELMACFLADAGFRSLIAANGSTGLVHTKAFLPSLIVCDAHMPEMNGLEVIEAVRSDPATAHIPIVLMSGNEPGSFDGADANAFLQKPFAMHEMVALVQRLAALPPPPRAVASTCLV